MFATVGVMDSSTDTALCEAAKRMRSEVWHLDGTQRLEQSRAACPELHRLIDEMVAVLDVDDPPIPILDAKP